MNLIINLLGMVKYFILYPYIYVCVFVSIWWEGERERDMNIYSLYVCLGNGEMVVWA